MESFPCLCSARKMFRRSENQFYFWCHFFPNCKVVSFYERIALHRCFKRILLENNSPLLTWALIRSIEQNSASVFLLLLLLKKHRRDAHLSCTSKVTLRQKWWHGIFALREPGVRLGAMGLMGAKGMLFGRTHARGSVPVMLFEGPGVLLL